MLSPLAFLDSSGSPLPGALLPAAARQELGPGGPPVGGPPDQTYVKVERKARPRPVRGQDRTGEATGEREASPVTE